MNPSVSCSSEERGEENSWVCESWDNPAPPPINAMSVGLETARQFHGRLDWDWDHNTTTAAAPNNNNNTNPLLQRHHHEQSDSEDQKPHIVVPPLAPTVSSFRHYNMGLGFSGHHPLGMLNSSGMRSFGDSNSGLPSSSSSSFHQSFLYPEMPSFAYGGCDSRSQLAQMMSIQNHHHHKHGGGGGGGGGGSGVFHDIVKREDLEYQATMLNLGHRAYFSSEDSAVSRLYKRSRALPPSSQAPRCQAEGCKTDLTNAKHYHRRHKVCEFHSKAATVITGGVHQRFCQQCSRFHALSEFDDAKRSCRKRLADHNRRRRKPQPNAVSSNTETPAPALKAEEDDNHSNKNGSGSSDTTRGVQVAPPGRTESQALMSAMSLPLMLQNSKAQISPNPNAASANCNANPNPALQQHKECQQQQQYSHSHSRSQNGPNLSMGLCNQRTQAQQEYSGLELALPWLRPSSEYSSSHHHHRPSPPMDILQPIMSEKSDVEGYSNSIQNFLPLSTSSSRDMGGGSSQWMVGNSDHESGHEHEQQMFSLLESPAAVRTEDDSSAAVEYLSHRRHHHHHHNNHGGLGLSSKDSTLQSLRPFGQSIYDSSL